MAYSQNFPAQRPSFMFDAANSGRIPPNMTFTRASTGTFFGTEKVLSSENIVAYSNDISTKTLDGVTATGSQTAPDGGTDAYKLTENSATGFHRFYEQIVTNGSAITFSAYFKHIGRQWVRIRLTDSGGSDRFVWFDIQNGVAGTAETGFSGASITSSGNGYYKVSATLATSVASGGTHYLVVEATSGDGVSGASIAGLNADAFAVWGLQVSSTGQTVLNETSGSIHREYQTKLQTAASGAARFEHSATDGQSGAKGLLIEGQVQNLFGYTEDFTQSDWTPTTSAITTGAAVAPSGDLTANLVVPNSGASFGQFYQTETLNSGTVYTLSFFAKNAGWGSGISLFFGTTGPWGSTGDQRYAQFNLSTGEAVLESGGVTGSSEDVGNGWRRYSVTTPATTVTTSAFPGLAVVNLSGSSITGDGYSGVLAWGAQLVPLSFSGSYVGSSSSSGATKALDSLSVASSSLFDNGGGTLYAEASQNVLDTYNGVFAVSDGTGANTIEIMGNSSSFRGQVVNANSTNASFIGGTITVGQFNKHALTFSSSEASYYVNGSEIGTTDSSVVVPTVSEIDIGNVAWSRPLNGHIRKVALYAEPISETAAAALTS